MTRAELLERMELELMQPPPAPYFHTDPDTRESLIYLLELIQRALAE